MNNVHEDQPVLLRSRWALSYLAGPLSRAQIKKLAKAPKGAVAAAAKKLRDVTTKAAQPSAAAVRDAVKTQAIERPVVPAEAAERFLPMTGSVGASDRIVYRPALVGEVSMHYANSRAGVDEWTKLAVWTPLDPELDGSPWDAPKRLVTAPELETKPEENATFAALPGLAERKTSYTKWSKQLKTAAYREYPIELWKSKKPKAISKIGETEGAFRGRVADLLHDARELRIEKLRKKYAPKLKRVQDRIERALEKVEREEQQYKDRKTQTIVSMGATVIGALFGRKIGSVGNVGRAREHDEGCESRGARKIGYRSGRGACRGVPAGSGGAGRRIPDCSRGCRG